MSQSTISSEESIEEQLHDLGYRHPDEDNTRLGLGGDNPNKDSLKWLNEWQDSEGRSNLLDEWLESKSTQLLWIRGRPGIGKTTIMTGLKYDLAEKFAEGQSRLKKATQLIGRAKRKQPLLSYIFCQRDDPRSNNAISVLKGLVYQLVNQGNRLNPSLGLIYLVRKHNDRDSRVLDGPNTFDTLRDIFREVLEHLETSQVKIYLLVDALDECSVGLYKLLDLITDRSYKANWLVTSRDDIMHRLGRASIKINIDSRPALSDSKVKKLATKNDSPQRRGETNDNTIQRPKSTLSEASEPKSPNSGYVQDSNLQSTSKPLDLESIRGIVSKSEEKDIVRYVTISYRPLHLQEFHAITRARKAPYKDIESLRKSVEKYGSFLIIHQDTIYFIHQSARDYFLTGPGREIISLSTASAHWDLMATSLQVMDSGLYKDMSSLQVTDKYRADRKQNVSDPLVGVRYACLYWVDHLIKALAQGEQEKEEQKSFLSDDGKIHKFLKTKFLHWVEAMSRMDKATDSIQMLIGLDTEVPKGATHLHEMIGDAKLFIHYNRLSMEEDALQLYSSALLFAPSMSIIKKQFKTNAPSWISIAPDVQDYWSPLLDTFKGHEEWVNAVAFSSDGRLVASASDDKTVRLWDAMTGATWAKLEGHGQSVTSVVFSGDGEFIASSSGDGSVRLWKASTGTLDCVLDGLPGSEGAENPVPVNSVAFSQDSQLIAWALDDGTITLWHIPGKKVCGTSKGHSGSVMNVAFSPNDELLVSGSDDETVRVWNIAKGLTGQSGAISFSEGSLLDGHPGPVSSVAFSPDGKLIASASGDGTVVLWCVSNGAIKHTLWGHSDSVNSVVFSPDGELVASASDDYTVRLWNVELGISHGILKGHSGWVRAVSFALNGQLASASNDSTIKIWDTQMGKLHRAQEEHSDSVTSLAFSPKNPHWYASASDDKTVKLWDKETGTIFATLEGHSDAVNCVIFSPNGELVASASDDGTIRLWNTASLEATQVAAAATVVEACYPLRGHEAAVNSIAFSPDNKLLASGSSDGTLILWDTATQKVINSLGDQKTPVLAVALWQDNDTGDLLVASASTNGVVKTWSKAKGATTAMTHEDWVRAIAFSRDGKLLASASDDRTVQICETAERAPRSTTLSGHLDWVRVIAFSPDGKILVSGSDDTTLRLWDITTLSNVSYDVLKGHSYQINSVEVSSDSRLIVSASDDRTVKVWDIKTRSLVSTFDGHLDWVRTAIFSPDGQQVVSGSKDKTVKLWDTKTGEVTAAAKGHSGPVNRIELSPDGKLVASLANDNIIMLWELTGKVHRTLRGHSGRVQSILFLPDGKQLVSASDDMTIRLWDISAGTGEVIDAKQGHLGPIRSIALSPPGSKNPVVLASGSDDKTVRLWDLKRREMRRALLGHKGPVNSVAFSPDGELLSSASDDRTVKVWDCEVESNRSSAVRTLPHPEEVKFVSFVGSRIASVSEDKSVRLWKMTSDSCSTLVGHNGSVTAIIASQDKRLVASADDQELKIWYRKKGLNEKPSLLDTIPTYGPIQKLSFSEDGSCLSTNRGYLTSKSLPQPPRNASKPSDSPIGFYVRNEWVVTLGGEKVLRLPPEYQPSSVAVLRNILVLGHRLGHLSFLKMQHQHRGSTSSSSLGKD